ncbi:MATE family efflux transporter [Vibrio sp. SS-MA-C1-2]|uniref:MATE family efflux transporter n=1 Tax=Vibrio sp. SS-MA-C1-2 TaxID=2908646 RepID=UPI001F404A2E|nr:MATE family efflux transporter [Vibrio sp. SS-MA-C1-2]UJF20008.1 MATE family efflux transporter [Vibrio sp. SS-MA-C1-2]
MANKNQAKFLDGSLMQHIMVMSGTGAIGLMALFAVDLLDMFFISQLGHVELAAAIGYAGSLLFFSTSISIGSSIAMGALVSKELGAGNREKARELAGSVLVFAVTFNIIIVSIMLYFLPELVTLLGAKGEAHQKALDYLYILLPSSPVIAISMAAMAALRGVGDAKNAMYATLAGGAVNAVLDPIFIFVLNLNVEGAAIASVIARFTVLFFALYKLLSYHKLVAPPSFSHLIEHQRLIVKIAFPAILTNVATPIANAYVTKSVAVFGDDYVAGFAVMGRIMPVCFAIIFSLSGAIGPIIGQNFGAERWDRVRQALNDAVIFTSLYCIGVSIILYFVQDFIIIGFDLTGDAAEVLTVFCTYIAVTFIFNGMLFIANAVFNNLQRPAWSMLLNIGKATIGTLPFVYFGGLWYGAIGILIGQAIGGILFGIIGYFLVRYRVKRMTDKHEREKEKERKTCLETGMPMTPYCSSRAYMAAADMQVLASEKKPVNIK